MGLQTLSDKTSNKRDRETDREGDTGPPTDNHCEEWAPPSHWVARLVNVCSDQKANTAEAPATCLARPFEGRGISLTEEQARQGFKGFTTSVKAEHSG